MTTPFKALLASTLFSLSAVTPGAAASCITPPASDVAISDFKSDPQALVRPSADTRTIEVTTRDLVATDASLAPDFIRLAKSTIPRFQKAIAAGLAQAAVACSTKQAKSALLIQQAVAGFSDAEFQATFAAVAGDLSTAATGAASAAADNSVGSVVVINPALSSGLSVPPGGGGNTAVLQIAAPAPALSLFTTGTASTSAASAADAVSATR
jgi:hypothetical protein